MNQETDPFQTHAPTGEHKGQSSEGSLKVADDSELPERIGRYRIESILGEGGFGRVYLGFDEDLQRSVAIKVPRRARISRAEDAEAFLTEARTLAQLDHPHIIPVHDVGRTDDGLCYVVSKVIKGTDLAKRLKTSRPDLKAAVGWIAIVAEALHYAHHAGLVHRDIKPANILIDDHDKPYVADFGLALKEEDYGKGAGFAGTPAYMSPEQARGEGHRVDGRSDIFSLGVVLYELMTGRRPFREESRDELLSQITSADPRPPRQMDDAIPKELERICLKCLAKRASDRYTTANDMADDLRHFLAESLHDGKIFPPSSGSAAPTGSLSTPPVVSAASTSLSLSLTSDQHPVRIVPKGLRSFDGHDADFFLELLPGPRDRDGLPDSIRFWKMRIENTDSEATFAVGLMYGPSGCGKSSLVKAGLLPHLSDEVIVVYVEATDSETEARLLHGIQKHCPLLTPNRDLKESLAALRRGQGLPAGRKIVIILDQFEQWLHAKKEEENPPLVQALRQCDGGRVQAIVMVRDDFWMAATRFMRELEIHLVEGQNSAAVDLFPIRHAEKVLAAFGRAFGTLPDRSGAYSKDQKRFLEQSVKGLAQEGKVICVRLALFAEMMKGKPWTPQTLKEVGGTTGVGLTFLEETFSAETAPPEHRLHQKAARAVLKALLPEAGAKIKGHMRSYGELLDVSGYTNRRKEFAELIRILDGEIRLITPTDPEGALSDEGNVAPDKQGGPDRKPPELPVRGKATAPSSMASPDDAAGSVPLYYQLAHDYLVHSLRDWLTQKQKETRRGRAELLLADRASIWNARKENRQLPSFWQWLNIQAFTDKNAWTESQRLLMARSKRLHALRGAMLLAMVGLVAFAGFTIRRQVANHNRATQAAGLVQRLLDANIAQVPGILKEMEPYRAWADPLLIEENEKAAAGSREKLRLSLALLPVDSRQQEYLMEHALTLTNPDAGPIIRDSLANQKDHFTEQLWKVVDQPDPAIGGQGLRAALLLARYDPTSPKWEKCGPALCEELVAENPIYMGTWIPAFAGVKKSFVRPLSAIFRDVRRRESERTLAANILAEYAADQPPVLVDLLVEADDKQFVLLFPFVKEHHEQTLLLLSAEMDKLLNSAANEAEKDSLAKRQASAAVALFKLGRPEKVWTSLRYSLDPRVRSYLIHRLNYLAADAKIIAKRLLEEKDLSIKRALLLCLGEFGDEGLSAQERSLLQPKVMSLYCDQEDAGLHAASEWLLRKWKQEKELKDLERRWAQDQQLRDSRIQKSAQTPATGFEEAQPRWFVNGQGQTMVILLGPAEFAMGAPKEEVGRGKDEVRHRQRIGRTFAIAAKPVTIEQYLRCHKDYSYRPENAPTKECPAHSMTWYQAVEYCNWLSQQEGLPPTQWCYEPNKNGKYEEGMKLAPDYLKRTGYRLPTEAEWEYACRAGTTTSRYYGETEDLLDKYGWFMGNSGERTWPVGSLKPNEWGLFDMQGNVYTWCQEREKDYKVSRDKPGEDVEDAPEVLDKEPRELRGSSFGNRGINLRSARRYRFVPTFRASGVGFRVARTIP